jgi:hypothetical protein
VLVFKNLAELNKRLKPIVIVLDSLPGKLERARRRSLAKTGIIFLTAQGLEGRSPRSERITG